MNLLSYNIRGGGSSSKRKRIGFLNQFLNIDVCFLQETKLSFFNDDLASSLWGNRVVEWMACHSIGVAGGMVILGRKGVLDLNYSFVGRGYV